jgi:hypothetical protein
MKRRTRTAPLSPLLYTIPETCTLLGLESRDAVYDRIRDGLLEAVDVAREGSTRTLLRVPSTSIEKYIAALPRVHP